MQILLKITLPRTAEEKSIPHVLAHVLTSVRDFGGGGTPQGPFFPSGTQFEVESAQAGVSQEAYADALKESQELAEEKKVYLGELANEKVFHNEIVSALQAEARELGADKEKLITELNSADHEVRELNKTIQNLNTKAINHNDAIIKLEAAATRKELPP